MFPNISKSKGNQTIKFCQFIEYEMRNIFHEISCSKCGGEISPGLFSKKSKLIFFCLNLDKMAHLSQNEFEKLNFASNKR